VESVLGLFRNTKPRQSVEIRSALTCSALLGAQRCLAERSAQQR